MQLKPYCLYNNAKLSFHFIDTRAYSKPCTAYKQDNFKLEPCLYSYTIYHNNNIYYYIYLVFMHNITTENTQYLSPTRNS